MRDSVRKSWDLDDQTTSKNVDGQTTMTRYMRDVVRLPLLTAEEETAIQQRLIDTRAPVLELEEKLKMLCWTDQTRLDLEQQLEEARQPFARVVDQYANHNLRLVVSIAMKYSGRKRAGIGLEDLVQEGYFGLRRAVEKFDPDRGCTLATYATWWIRQAINRALNRQGGAIYLPDYLQFLMRKLKRVEVKMELQDGQVSEEGVARQLDISMEKLARLREVELLQKAVSLDVPIDGDGEGGTFMELLTDADQLLPDTDSVGKQLEEILDGLFSRLTEREQYVMRERIVRGRTLEQIGADLGLTRERIRQVQVEARGKIAAALQRRALQEKID